MSNREEALRAFKEHYPFTEDPIAWSAWKQAWDLAYQTGYNRAVDDAANVLVFGCKDTPSEEQMSKLIKLKI